MLLHEVLCKQFCLCRVGCRGLALAELDSPYKLRSSPTSSRVFKVQVVLCCMASNALNCKAVALHSETLMEIQV